MFARSTIEAEALALIEGAEGGMLVSEWWKEICKTEIGIPIKVFTDSKTLHNAARSMTKVINMRLRVDIAYIRELLEERCIKEINWVSTRCQVADIFTKEGVKKDVIRKYV